MCGGFTGRGQGGHECYPSQPRHYECDFTSIPPIERRTEPESHAVPTLSEYLKQKTENAYANYDSARRLGASSKEVMRLYGVFRDWEDQWKAC